MGERTGIAWTDATWNPWHGCLKVSPGCAQCYMYREKEQYGQDPKVVQRSKTKFTEPLKWRAPQRVFTCSWSDFFIEQADAWRAEAWEVIRRTPHLTYQILTKRPENIPSRLPADWGPGYPNVWLGVSVESQRYAGERIPLLFQVPATLLFVSLEPLLAPVSLSFALQILGWVIVGGESGSKARTMDLDNLRAIVNECRAARVPVFTKQDSGPRPGRQGRIPDELWVHEFPRVAA